MKTEGCLLPCLWVKIKDFGLSYGVHDETPLFLAAKVPFRLHAQKYYYQKHFCFYFLLFLFLDSISTGLLSTAY